MTKSHNSDIAVPYQKEIQNKQMKGEIRWQKVIEEKNQTNHKRIDKHDSRGNIRNNSLIKITRVTLTNKVKRGEWVDSSIAYPSFNLYQNYIQKGDKMQNETIVALVGAVLITVVMYGLYKMATKTPTK